MKHSILIVDDEKDILEVLSYNLKKEGYHVYTSNSGIEALTNDFSIIDLIILDVMIPGMDGYEICKRLKDDPKTAHIPVIFLTAKSSVGDEVHGLNIGAEDYIVKPISIPKLLARVRTALRRESQPALAKNVIHIKGIEVDVDNYSIKVDAKETPFTKKEFETLLYLIKHKEKIVSRDTLLSKIWGTDVIVGPRTVDVHIRNIREKLGDKHSMITTIKGVGYRLEGD